ncbi:nuclear transport factor 2 family protein [Novosphingobium arvoryzae]|uniref:SnoaL-like domain-containing protein n=1 Tax=Novosphingobium arvoryzae TaxID=1256514 RepID=A0A918R768_9SPHN|nr:nuclear transport factor 2 family protein [Novosphingobium arvoryzae]GGZ88190.1 hypothetical protein GCM10011617_03790 [Novosphingobium arvoryzae]
MFTTVKTLFQEYGRRSIDGCMACMAPGGQTMAYGTNANEKRLGSDEIREQFLLDWSQTSSATITPTWHHEVQHGDCGWVVADLRFDFEMLAGKQQAETRATFVLQRDGAGRWLIEHMHFSAPAELATNTQLVD